MIVWHNEFTTLSKVLKNVKISKKKQKTNTQQFFQHVKRKTGVRFCRWYLTCCLDTGHVVFLFPVQIPSMWCSIFLKCMASCHSLYKKKPFFTQYCDCFCTRRLPLLVFPTRSGQCKMEKSMLTTIEFWHIGVLIHRRLFLERWNMEIYSNEVPHFCGNSVLWWNDQKTCTLKYQELNSSNIIAFTLL